MEKVALITAGGSGMGADSARALAADGFKVGLPNPRCGASGLMKYGNRQSVSFADKTDLKMTATALA